MADMAEPQRATLQNIGDRVTRLEIEQGHILSMVRESNNKLDGIERLIQSAMSGQLETSVSRMWRERVDKIEAQAASQDRHMALLQSAHDRQAGALNFIRIVGASGAFTGILSLIWVGLRASGSAP